MNDNKNEFAQTTDDLKKLFKKNSNSGKDAWEIGNLLSKTHKEKLYKSSYKKFEDYTLAEFDKTAQTAYAYIKIRDRFERDEIPDDFLVTHLKVISDFENSKIGDIVLKAIEKITKEAKKDEKITIPSTKDISLTFSLLSKTDDISKDEVTQILKEISKEAKATTSKKRKRKDKFGNRLKSKAFPIIEELFENEPIDEMGTVALFCTMFPYLKGIKFFLQSNILEQHFLIVKSE
jgi:hypothetical protein